MHVSYRAYVEQTFGPRRVRLVRALRWALLVVSACVLGYLGVFIEPEAPHAVGAIVLLSVLTVAAVAVAFVYGNLWANHLTRALYHRVLHERLIERLLNETTTKGETFVEFGSDSERRFASRDLAEDLGFPVTELPTPQELADLKEFVGRPRLFGRACGYCGQPHAPVVCGQCGSIQWGNLEAGGLAPHMPEWWWSVATFFDKYRWEIASAVIPTMLTAVVAIDATAITSNRDSLARQQASFDAVADAFITATVQYRGSLHALEASCGGNIHRDELCRDLYQQLNQYYMHFSWYGEPLIQRLRARVCDQPSVHPADQPACNVIADGSPIDAVDTAFGRYLAELHSQHPDRVRRRVAALNLYQAGRVVNCVVAQLHWVERPVGIDRDRSCERLLREGWHDVDEVPDCDPESATGEWGCLAWEE